jgi:hypothetical protein
MRRILTAALASALLALALPAAASAHHHAHKARAHRHHRHHHHMVVFRPSATPSDTTPAPTSDPVATVDSFEGGVLKITLPDGSTVSGKVTEDTWISCGCSGHDFSSGGPEWQHDGHDGWDHSGDDDDQGDFHHDGEQGSPPCGTSSLVSGAKVKEAELNVSSAGAIWEKVVLEPQS